MRLQIYLPTKETMAKVAVCLLFCGCNEDAQVNSSSTKLEQGSKVFVQKDAATIAEAQPSPCVGTPRGVPLDLCLDCSAPLFCKLTLSNTGSKPLYLRKSFTLDSIPGIRTIRLFFLDGEKRVEIGGYLTNAAIMQSFGWLAPTETVEREIKKDGLSVRCRKLGGKSDSCSLQAIYQIEHFPGDFKDKPVWQQPVTSNIDVLNIGDE